MLECRHVVFDLHLEPASSFALQCALYAGRLALLVQHLPLLWHKSSKLGKIYMKHVV